MEGLTRTARVKNSIAKYFRLTFRRHSGEEYTEILTRGMRGSGNRDEVNLKYPWAYIRLFGLLFVLFAIFLLIVRFTSNELFVPTITVISATCFNLTFLLFLFELYPKKDLSFMAVCLAMLLGGAIANITAQIMFSLFRSSNEWVQAVYAGLFEEFAKAAATVLIIVVSRKSSPLAGFMLGAAVGCGFSIAEDMGYVFMEANRMSVMNMTALINISVSRGLTAVCTHTLWTAAVGWAYCHFTRHLANIVFYLVALLSCGLHICWDLPLGYVAQGFVCAGCIIVACVGCILIVYFERRRVFRKSLSAANAESVQLGIFTDGENKKSSTDGEGAADFVKTNPVYWKHWGSFTLALGVFLMAVVSVIYCSIPFRETYGSEVFTDAKEFISFMQDGMEFNADRNRPYDDKNTENDETSAGRVTQPVRDGDFVYRYVYTINDDSKFSGNIYYFLEAVYATVDATGDNYVKEDVYNEGKLYASFFRVNASVSGYNFRRNGDVEVFVYNPDFVRDYSDPRYLALFATFGGIFGVSAICYISLVIKSRRVKKLCSTETVSSVK